MIIRSSMEGNDGHVTSSEVWIMNASLKRWWSKSKHCWSQSWVRESHYKLDWPIRTTWGISFKLYLQFANTISAICKSLIYSIVQFFFFNYCNPKTIPESQLLYLCCNVQLLKFWIYSLCQNLESPHSSGILLLYYK